MLSPLMTLIHETRCGRCYQSLLYYHLVLNILRDLFNVIVDEPQGAKLRHIKSIMPAFPPASVCLDRIPLINHILDGNSCQKIPRFPPFLSLQVFSNDFITYTFFTYTADSSTVTCDVTN